MKDNIIRMIAVIFILACLWVTGVIVLTLGIKLPIELWKAGHGGWAIIQAILVWSYPIILGGNHK